MVTEDPALGLARRKGRLALPRRAVFGGPLLAAVASGVLALLAYYPRSHPLLLAVAPVPALVAAFAVPAAATAIGAVVGVIATLDLWRALGDPAFGTPLFLRSAFAAAYGASGAGVYATTAALAPRLPAAAAVLVFPAIVVVFEYALAAAPGLWFTPSATLATAPWAAAVSRWLGPHGATFVVALVASTIAVGFIRPRETLRAAIPLLVASVIVAGAVTSVPHALPDHVRVAAVVARVPADVDRRWRDGEASPNDEEQVLVALEALVRARPSRARGSSSGRSTPSSSPRVASTRSAPGFRSSRARREASSWRGAATDCERLFSRSPPTASTRSDSVVPTDMRDERPRSSDPHYRGLHTSEFLGGDRRGSYEHHHDGDVNYRTHLTCGPEGLRLSSRPFRRHHTSGH